MGALLKKKRQPCNILWDIPFLFILPVVTALPQAMAYLAYWLGHMLLLRRIIQECSAEQAEKSSITELPTTEGTEKEGKKTSRWNGQWSLDLGPALDLGNGCFPASEAKMQPESCLPSHCVIICETEDAEMHDTGFCLQPLSRYWELFKLLASISLSPLLCYNKQK